MKRIILAGLLGGLVVFVWSSISWMALPWHNATMHNIPNEDAVAKVLKETIPGAGLYIHPGMSADETKMAEKYKAGPIFTLIYTPKGMEMMDPAIFLKGLILDFIVGIIAAWLLVQALPSLAGLMSKALFVGAIGLFCALHAHGNNWNWMMYPADYTLVLVADTVISWLLAGAAMGALLKKG